MLLLYDYRLHYKEYLGDLIFANNVDPDPSV